MPKSGSPRRFSTLNQSLSEETYEILSPFIGYREQTWIGFTAAGRRRETLFESGVWNVPTSMDEDVPRTTN